MYYSLKEEYLLRGWDLLPTGIVKKQSGEAVFLDPDIFQLIQNKRWMLFEKNPFLSEKQRSFFDAMVQRAVIELTEKPRPLTPEQEYRRYPNRYLYGIHWAITGNCNCRCRHCYMSAPSGKAGEYSTDECLRIIQQMENAGVQVVTLTGGEALVRKDFYRIIEEISKAGIKIDTIMSNGLLVSEKLLDRLDELGQKPKFNMSFDGIGQHDWLRGIKGVEKTVIKAFRLCHDRGFRTGSEYCLHKRNISVLRDSVKLLADCGCSSLKVNGLRAEGEGAHIQDEILSPEEEFQIYLDYIPQFYEDKLPVSVMLSGVFFGNGKKHTGTIPFEKGKEEEDCSSYCLCGHARNQMHITADGFIVPCIPIGSVECGRSRFPNIHDVSIVEALQDSVYMDFIDTRLRDYFRLHPECEACEYRNRCAGGCRGNAAYDGELMGRDMKVCKFYKDGWYDKTVKQLADLGIRK